MTGHAFLKLALLGSLSFVPFAAGCAVDASSPAGESTSEELSTTAAPRLEATTAQEVAHDPLCRQTELRSDACILDSQWHEDAVALCASYGMKLENFIPSNSCEAPGGPPTPGPTTGSNIGPQPTGTEPTGVSSVPGEPSTGGSTGGSTGSGSSTGPISTVRFASTSVIVDCCNGGVGPIVPPAQPVSSGAAK